jgi:ubiquitin C-terminal hydrolase
MDLLPYNKNYALKKNGFRNIGNTCYFNSLLQCLMSCTSIFETLDKNKDLPYYKDNIIAQDLLKLYTASKSGEDISQKCIPIWVHIMKASSQRKDKIIFRNGNQEDATEGLMIFLDIMDHLPEIKRLFEHRHLIEIYCKDCNQIVSTKKAHNMVFEVQANLATEQLEEFASLDKFYGTTMQLNDFLKKQNGYVDKDYECPKCKVKSNKFMTTVLTMIPEILPIVIKKYNNNVRKLDVNTPFPENLEFTMKGNKEKLVYTLVAQCEHSGDVSGGHYYAIGLREDGWKLLNDSYTSDANPGPTTNSYMVFYHFVKIEKI